MEQTDSCQRGDWRGDQMKVEGINIQNFYRTYKAQLQKTSKSSIRKGKGPGQTLLQRQHTDGQQTYEKMLSVTNHQRNGN